MAPLGMENQEETNSSTTKTYSMNAGVNEQENVERRTAERDSRTRTKPGNNNTTTNSKHTPVSRSKLTIFMRALFLFQLSTQLYVSVLYLIPWFIEEGSGLDTTGDDDQGGGGGGAMTGGVSAGVSNVWFLQMVFGYLCVVMVTNWVCVIKYSSEYTGPPDVTATSSSSSSSSSTSQQWQPNSFAASSYSSFLPDGNERHHLPHHDHVTVDVTEKGGLPWGYCERCQMDVPPRTVHCRFCRACVLRRDHHCHLVGCCIGHWNQRFFVAMAANGMVLGMLGAYLTVAFLYFHHRPRDSLWDYFLPVTIVKYLLGKLSGLQTLLTFHAYMLCSFGPISGHYFATQMCLIGTGRTKREVTRQIKTVVTSSVCANIRMVFGYCWYWSLLFPAPHLLFPQLHQGLHYDHVKLVPQ